MTITLQLRVTLDSILAMFLEREKSWCRYSIRLEERPGLFVFLSFCLFVFLSFVFWCRYTILLEKRPDIESKQSQPICPRRTVPA